MMRSPPASSAASGALPSPNSAILPSVIATQPCSITRSARTTRALPRVMSCLAVISNGPSGGSGERGHVDDAVGNPMTDLVVMDDRDHRDTLGLLLGNQLNHHGTVGGVKRGGRLVQ